MKFTSHLASFFLILPPLRRRHKSSCPDPAHGSSRFGFFGLVGVCKAVCQGPTLLHHPRVYVGAIGKGAYRNDTLVFVESFTLACQLLPSDVCPDLARGCSSAGPYLSFRVGTCLIQFGRIDAVKANVSVRYADCIAIDDPCFANDGRKRLGIL